MEVFVSGSVRCYVVLVLAGQVVGIELSALVHYGDDKNLALP